MNVVISMFCVNGTLRKGRVEKEQVQNSDYKVENESNMS